MNSQINKDRYIPSYMNAHFDGYRREEFDNVDSNCEVFFTTVADGRGYWCAIGYSGKGAKHDFHHYWLTEEAMLNHVEKYKATCLATVQYKAEQKAKKKAQNNSVVCEVGTIVVNSWGYDQTNVDYYQVVKVTNKTATLREISSKTVDGSDGFMCCRVVPVKDSFIGEEFIKRIQGYNGVPYFSFSYGGCSVVEEGQSNYCSWYA